MREKWFWAKSFSVNSKLTSCQIWCSLHKVHKASAQRQNYSGSNICTCTDVVEIGFWTQKVIQQSVTPSQKLRKSCMICCMTCCMTCCMNCSCSGGRPYVSAYPESFAAQFFVGGPVWKRQMSGDRERSYERIVFCYIGQHNGAPGRPEQLV